MTKESEMTFNGESSREDFMDFEELFNGVESFMGYLPNAYLSMAEQPALLSAFSGLAASIFQSEGIDIQTKQLIALASSLASGCKYCQAHTSHGAERAGVENEKIVDILNYVESTKYSDKEKAVLDLSFAAGKTPNQSTQRHFDNLNKHFSNKEITDIVSVIALFGFLNRWNDTMGTVLEDVPENFVENQLKPLGWS